MQLYMKKQQPDKKMGRGLEYIRFQRHIGGQQTCEKMISITNHQGNANQNHDEISLDTCHTGCYKEDNK